MKSISLSITLLMVSVLPSTAYSGSRRTALQASRASQASRGPVSLLVKTEPVTLVNGSPCLFIVRPSQRLKSLAGLWQGRRVFFYFDAADELWRGFAAVSIATASGHHRLTLTATLPNGGRISSQHAIPVGRMNYSTIELGVSEIFTAPDAKMLARIRRERALKNRAFSLVTEKRLWHGRFISPIHNTITEGFGVYRIFNRRRQGIHQGLDFRAGAGTPVTAINSGRVAVAHNMFYEGGFVLIDHGQGLLSLYMHLSQIKVNPGDWLKRGDIIGLSGDTGRATGPHLHVGVRWQGIYLDPETLLALKL